MKFKHIFKTALSGLRNNRSRSVLTILGIVIGVTAIILIISLGKSAQDLILGQIQGLGTKTLAIVPGRQPSGPSDFANVFLDSLKERDLRDIQNKGNVPHAEYVMPVVFGSVRTAYGSETYQATVLGAGSAEAEGVLSFMFDLYTSRGEFFTSADVKAKASVAVIGDKVRRELFVNTDPIDQKIKINDRSFRVVGVLPSKGQVSFFNFDEMVLVPYTTAGQYLLGKKNFDRILVAADSEEAISSTVRDIEILLRANHSITDPEKDDFFIETQADLAERLATVTDILTIFLASVAAISLFVGGIGIMNIMLVSVMERTREIGLRKALGATEKDIMKQFLLEAVLLTGTGGFVGIVLGTLLSIIAALALSFALDIDWGFVFPISGALLGLSVSVVIGLIFGIYPARHASRMNPIDALRHE